MALPIREESEKIELKDTSHFATRKEDQMWLC